MGELSFYGTLDALSGEGEGAIHFRGEPRMLVGLPRLIARLPVNRSEKDEFEGLYQRVKIGFSGELKVDYFLESLGLPNSVRVLKNIELSVGEDSSFQIDTLIISAKYILLLEVKNIAGELTFESSPHQLVRNLKGQITKMDCPITQLVNTKSYFEKWLRQRGFQVAVIGKVILANQQAFVKSAPKDAPILFMKELPSILRKLESYSDIMGEEERLHLIEKIKQDQVVYDPFPLSEYFRLDPNLLKKNQLCPNCNLSLVYVNHKTRHCTNCRVDVRTNYESALQDWFMVFKGTITNRECQEFLGLKTRHQASHAIKVAGLKKVGQSVATKYIWPPNKPFKTEK